MDLKLENKVFVLTGGSRGIGRSILKSLISEGALVTFCGRDTERVQETIVSLGGLGSIEGVVCDVLESGFSEKLISRTIDRFGGIDGIVANVGLGRGTDVPSEYSWSDWQYSIDINVKHPLDLVMASAPHLESSENGSVVFVSSISGRYFGPGLQYSSSKSMMTYVAQALGRSLASRGIRVNSVSPGSIDIDGGHWNNMKNEKPEKFHSFLQESFPGGRLGEPEEIADIVTFLLSNRASLINGADIAADGGQLRPTNRKF